MAKTRTERQAERAELIAEQAFENAVADVQDDPRNRSNVERLYRAGLELDEARAELKTVRDAQIAAKANEILRNLEENLTAAEQRWVLA